MVHLHRWRERAQVLLPARWILLAVGIGSIFYSQSLMETRQIVGTPLPMAELWNITYRLEIINFSNVLSALPYLLIGMVLCALTAMPSEWKKLNADEVTKQFPDKEANWAFLFVRILVGIAFMVFILIQLGKHEYVPIYLVFWIGTIVIFTQVFWRWDRNAKIDLLPGITSRDLLWLAGLLILGFGIASFALQDIPIFLVPDEGSFWETARAIAIKQFHPVIFDSGVYTFPVASSVFQGVMMRWFGVNFWGWRFASVIAAVLTIIPLYLLGREWFDRRTAILAGVMMIANPYFLAFARLGYNNSQALFPVTLAIYFFTISLRKGSYFYLWLAGLAIGLGFYTYFAAWLGLVVLCLTIVYLRLLKQVSWRQAFIILAIILGAWIVTSGPRIAYIASGDWKEGLVYKIFETSFANPFYGRAYYSEAELGPITQLSEHSSYFYDPLVYSELLTRAVVRTLSALFDPYIVSEHFLANGLTGVVTPVFFAIGLALSLTRLKQPRFGILILWLVSGLIFLSILGSFPPRHTHLVSVIPCFALIAGTGLSAAIASLGEQLAKWKTARSAFEIILALSVCGVITYYGTYRYFVQMPPIYPASFEDVASWIAWRTRTPINIIYVSSSDVPHRVKYIVDSKMVPHGYTSALLNEFTAQSDPITDRPTVIFIESHGEQAIPFLQKPPPGFRAPVAYYFHDGTLLGYALTNADIDLQPKVGMDDGLNSLLNTPIRGVLIALIVVLVITGAVELSQLRGWPPEEILLEIHNERKEKEDESDGFEFDFRLRIPPHKRKAP
jgi:4-amino-4-deoxy-L-arabinose transferase-like glycosyltransferase